MQYAVHYNRLFRHFDEVDEVVFDYQGSESIVDFIPSILKKQEQKAVINLVQIEEIQDVIPFLNKLKTLHSNILVQIDFFKQKKFIEILQDNNIDYMFSTFAKDYDTLYSMIDLGAKEIYLVEFLCFCLNNLQQMREDKNIKFRVFPDIAQSAAGTTKIIPAMTKFWIRPEDTELYERYIDTFEICRMDDRQSVVYEIYKRQQWLGRIDDIILDLETNVENTNLDPHFGQERINCGKRCIYSKCNLCQEMENLALRFNLAGISIEKKKKKNEISQEDKEKLMNQLKTFQEKIEANESKTNEETV